MKVMWRSRWKIRKSIKNIKRLITLILLVGIGAALYKDDFSLPDADSINNWVHQGISAIIFMVLLFMIYKWLRFYLKRRKLKRANIHEIDNMTGEQFEQYLGFFFSRLGYKAKVTQLRGDYGADVILKKDGITTVVQAKRYKNKVGNKAVQEIVASKKIYNAENAMCVTNSFFTKPAIELARANDVELWDRNRLIKELARLNMGSTTLQLNAYEEKHI